MLSTKKKQLFITELLFISFILVIIMNSLTTYMKGVGAAALTLALVFPFVEPVLLSAQTFDTDDVIVTQTVTSGISITDGSDINLTALSTTQNSAVGSSTWNVKTNNQAGYTLTVQASAAPALVDSGTSESFTDYTEASSGVPETWSVSNAYEFGFSAYGTHVPTGTWGTDSDCLDTANVPSATLNWEGFDGTNPIQIASSAAETTTAGVDSVICVATGQDTVFAPSGTYQATITATATVQ